jgi:hypothetical protein
MTRTVFLIVHQEFFAPGNALDSPRLRSCRGNTIIGHPRTFPVFLSMTQRETVTVAVLFMKPAFVTMPRNDMGGIFE